MRRSIARCRNAGVSFAVVCATPCIIKPSGYPAISSHSILIFFFFKYDVYLCLALFDKVQFYIYINKIDVFCCTVYINKLYIRRVRKRLNIAFHA